MRHPRLEEGTNVTRVARLYVLALAAFACDAPDDSAPRHAMMTHEATPATDRDAASAAPAAAASVAHTALTIDLGSPGREWRSWMEASVVRLRQHEPAFSDRVSNAAPGRTRAGTLRFTDPELGQPAALPLLLHRLVSAQETAEVRVALAELVPRTAGPFAAAARDLVATDHEPGVRAAFAAAAYRLPGPQGLEILEPALADADSMVRAVAARTVARHPQGDRLAEPLRSLLADPSPEPRAAAARSLGALRHQPAQADLAATLHDPVAEVRLQSLHALARLDPRQAARLPAVDVLQSDPDPRISRAARQLTAQRLDKSK